LIEVIGQISWHDVKKSARTTVWPLSEASVKLFPDASNIGALRTSDGMGAFRSEPPPAAGAPWPAASGEAVG